MATQNVVCMDCGLRIADGGCTMYNQHNSKMHMHKP